MEEGSDLASRSTYQLRPAVQSGGDHLSPVNAVNSETIIDLEMNQETLEKIRG